MTRRRGERQAGAGIFLLLLAVIVGELFYIAWVLS